MTKLTKPVRRITTATVREAGKMRPVIVTLEPPYSIAFRAKGCRTSYKLIADACYWLAIKAEQQSKKRQSHQPKN